MQSLTMLSVKKMATMTIRNLDDEVERRIRIRVAEHNCSMEEEVQSILRAALAVPAPAANLVDAIRARFAPFGGVELDIPSREVMRDPPGSRGGCPYGNYRS